MYTYIYVYRCNHIYTYMYNIYIYKHITYIYIYIHTCIIYIYINISHIYIYIYTYKHITYIHIYIYIWRHGWMVTTILPPLPHWMMLWIRGIIPNIGLISAEWIINIYPDRYISFLTHTDMYVCIYTYTYTYTYTY